MTDLLIAALLCKMCYILAFTKYFAIKKTKAHVKCAITQPDKNVGNFINKLGVYKWKVCRTQCAIYPLNIFRVAMSGSIPRYLHTKLEF